MTTKSTLLAALFALLTFSPPLARAAMWWAQPIIVHEWGVHQFDYSQPTASPPADLPPYIYTDTHPGLPVPLTAQRVKDLPPDSGIRDKPLLYFYPSYKMDVPKIGIELRFAQGHANAWYPQANVYRTPNLTAQAPPPDFTTWQKTTNRFSPRMNLPVPDDTRMELAWYSLTLSKTLPPNAHLPGQNLPATHWTQLARNVPAAAYLTNGTETEKYLFYEGATHEQPAIAIIPSLMFTKSGAPMQLVNISDQPIYNVFAIYHAAGHTWVGYISSLDPMPPETTTAAGNTIATLPLPDFIHDPQWTDPATLPAATTARLLSALTEGSSFVPNVGLRDPADPQGKTTSAQLFPDEAAALEKIWHNDFFQPPTNGLTIIYRESPATLDAAMPLNLYTDMYHYISLSRCGLVLNSNINLKLAAQIFDAVTTALYGNNPPDRQSALTLLRQNPLLAHTALAYYEHLYDPKRCQTLHQQLDAP